MPLGEHVIHDYRALSLSLKAHPVSFMRNRLDRDGVTPNALLASIPNGRRVSVSGLVLVRQRPGKGNAIFLTLEDEGGIANIIVWARKFERFRPVIMGGRCIRVGGRLQSESGVVHIVADEMEDISAWLAVLCEDAPVIESRARGDEATGGSADPRGLPRRRSASDTAAATEKARVLSRNANTAMPKGRNFH